MGLKQQKSIPGTSITRMELGSMEGFQWPQILVQHGGDARNSFGAMLNAGLAMH